MARGNDYDFCAVMADGKAAAFHRAQRSGGGGSLVTIGFGTTAPGPRLEAGTWDHTRERARYSWRSDRDDAVAQYRFDVYGDEWEGL